RDPARPVPELRQQPAAVPALAGVLPHAPAADADRVGRARPDLPARRRGTLQARPEDAGVPPARRRPLRPRDRGGHDRPADARVPRDEAGVPRRARALPLDQRDPADDRVVGHLEESEVLLLQGAEFAVELVAGLRKDADDLRVVLPWNAPRGT